MKMSSKASVFALLGALAVLSACAPTSSVTQQPPESTVVMCKSPFDEEAVYTAVKNKDAKYCEKIETPELKKDCNQKVKDQLAYDKAMEGTSASACGSIVDPQLNFLCTEQMKDVKAREDAKITTQKTEQKEIASEAKIEQSGDIKACDSLTLGYLKTQCTLNIASDLASKNKDPKYCSPVEDPALREICERVAQ